MLVSISGTPGTGKTSLCLEMADRGYDYRELGRIVAEHGLSEDTTEGSLEQLVEPRKLRRGLSKLDLGSEGIVLLDGHLSYLAPSDICIVLRLHPEEIRKRLNDRGYDRRKIDENVEAEAVSVILIEAVEEEADRLHGRPWTDLPEGGGIVMEVDVSEMNTAEMADTTEGIFNAYRGKRLNELAEYRPGRVDWREGVSGWD
ncbi:MAG: adenylate kinase family protein [Thermoplasmatota archaeon]